MKIADAVEPRIHELLRQATEWRFLGLLFERPREGWWQDVEALVREVGDPELKAAAEAAREEADQGLYLALLGPGGAVSPREVAYRGMKDPGHILAEIMAFYEAFAFRPATEEPPDHLAVEAGFLGYLCLKEAYARARRNDEEAEIAGNAAARFLKDHLSVFAWPVLERGPGVML
jgi:nitrate reductase assembly molybdenum cofactor insertion protein NarJ